MKETTEFLATARKWRPETFEEVTGQEGAMRALQNAVATEHVHHAYLFTGTRGVGKTTAARLIAKALNCRKGERPNPQPCRRDDDDACDSCTEIAAGNSLDVREIDAASNTGVNDVRDVIIDSIKIMPVRDRYKIFIIDEAHMLSNSSFNALLKTLEEPPSHVVFVLATTEHHKLPQTILSRCQQYQFRSISLEKINERLSLIASADDLDISPAAIKEIARAGKGSMRDAQSALDQVVAFSGAKIETADVEKTLGLPGAEVLKRTMRAIYGKKPGEILDIVGDLNAQGHDLRGFCQSMCGLFRDLLVVKIFSGQEEDAKNGGEEPESQIERMLESAAFSIPELAQMSSAFTQSDLTRFFESMNQTEQELKTSTQTRYGAEMGLVKLIEMRRIEAAETIMQKIGELEERLAAAGGFASIAESAPSASQKSPASADHNETIQ